MQRNLATLLERIDEIALLHKTDQDIIQSAAFKYSVEDFSQSIRHYDDQEFSYAIIDLVEAFHHIKNPLTQELHHGDYPYELKNSAREAFAVIINGQVTTAERRQLLIEAVTDFYKYNHH